MEYFIYQKYNFITFKQWENLFNNIKMVEKKENWQFKKYDEYYLVTSNDWKSSYKVKLDFSSCDCPSYIFNNYRGTGGSCKHIQWLVDELQKLSNKNKKIIIENGMFAIDFIEKYSEEDLDLMIIQGEIIEQRGVLYNVK